MLFLLKLITEVCRFDKTVCESAALTERVQDHLAAIGAAALALLLAEDNDLLRPVRLSKKRRLHDRIDKGGFGFRGIVLAAGGTDKGFADLLEPVINRFRPHEGDLATGGTVNLSGSRFVHERFGR